jgi:hypothetical protein
MDLFEQIGQASNSMPAKPSIRSAAGLSRTRLRTIVSSPTAPTISYRRSQFLKHLNGRQWQDPETFQDLRGPSYSRLFSPTRGLLKVMSITFWSVFCGFIAAGGRRQSEELAGVLHVTFASGLV